MVKNLGFYEPANDDIQQEVEPKLLFKLRTMAGEFAYRINLNDEADYVLLLRTMFGAMISLNPDIDPQDFKGKIWEALVSLGGAEELQEGSNKYPEGDWRNALIDDGDEDEEKEKLEAEKAERAKQETEAVVSNLPPVKEFTLNILHFDDDDYFKISNLIGETLSEKEIKKAMKHKKFTLPADKAKELYTKLRNCGLLLTITPGQAIKKIKLAGKKSLNRSFSKTKSSKSLRKKGSIKKAKKRLPVLNGKEKLNDKDVVISN